jgi:tRNA-Thr(GGU) m(6)t(6)A37 methyltransferase TsaA
MTPPSLTLTPIGFARTPFDERVRTPRQPSAAAGARGTIELEAGRGYEHALCDLDVWQHLWILFWFDRNRGWRPKVLPPRSRRRRGVFATRSPHRPNPLGLSVVELERIDGLVLHLRNVDFLDGTPVLDIKPYLPSEAIPNPRQGWLTHAAEAEAGPSYDVVFAEQAAAQAGYLSAEFGLDLQSALGAILALGPAPHPYRRIRRTATGMRIAFKDWRADFTVDAQRIVITRIQSGYRPRELASVEPALASHRAFVARFG